MYEQIADKIMRAGNRMGHMFDHKTCEVYAHLVVSGDCSIPQAVDLLLQNRR